MMASLQNLNFPSILSVKVIWSVWYSFNCYETVIIMIILHSLEPEKKSLLGNIAVHLIRLLADCYILKKHLVKNNCQEQFEHGMRYTCLKSSLLLMIAAIRLF